MYLEYVLCQPVCGPAMNLRGLGYRLQFFFSLMTGEGNVLTTSLSFHCEFRKAKSIYLSMCSYSTHF